MPEAKDYAKEYLQAELNRLQMQKDEAQDKLAKARTQLEKVNAGIADIKRMLGIT